MTNSLRPIALLLMCAAAGLPACSSAGPDKASPSDKSAPTAKPAEAARPAGGGAVAGLETEDQKTIYALGLVISQNLNAFAFSEAELKILERGLEDGVMSREAKVDVQVYGPKIRPFQTSRQGVAAEAEKKVGQAYVEKAAAEKGAQKLPSGVVYIETQAGTGQSPKATDEVEVHYTGTLIDGTKFDSSVDRGQPATFPLNGVVKCWTEGLQKMKAGGKARLVCPSDTAYGDHGSPPRIKPGATLLFDVELLKIKSAAAAAPSPVAP